MSLKVELKPGERIIVGTAVLRNGDQRVRFFIEGEAPILREKDILTPATADTPAKNVYLAIQLMYLGSDTSGDTYLSLAGEFLAAVPSAAALISAVNNDVLSGELYKALKLAKKLIAYEKDLLDHVSRRRDGLREGLPDGAIAA